MILSVVLFYASMASGKESVMLPKNIQSVLKHRNLNPSSLSVLIVDLENEDIILSWNSKVPARWLQCGSHVIRLYFLP